MKRTTIGILVTICVIAIVIIFSIWQLQKLPGNYSGATEAITIAILPSEYSTLLWVAEDQGFFRQNGLNVTMKEYTTGASSLNALSTGNADFSVSSEFAFITKVLNGSDIQMVTNIDKAENEYLIGRKDKGILNISDLKGKKIGVLRNGAAEFYLGRYLNLHGISLEEVTIVNQPFAQSVISMSDGTIDATLLPEPQAYAIQNNLGKNAISWPAQSGQLLFMAISCNKATMDKNPEVIDKLLRSLYLAEEFVLTHPGETKTIVQEKMQYDSPYMEKIWPEHRFRLTLEQALIVAMEDETRWMMKNNLTNKRVMPNYLDYINTISMNSIKPESMNIIR